MPNHRNRFPARRRFLKQTAALSARAASLGTTGLLLAGAASGAGPAEQSSRDGGQSREANRPRARGSAGALREPADTAAGSARAPVPAADRPAQAARASASPEAPDRTTPPGAPR